jgi:acyl carrier protein
MDIKEFAANFAAQFEDAEIVELLPETKFRELPTWDSMTAMCVQTMILDDYQVTLPDTEFKAMATVQDVYDFVANAKKQ